MTSRAPIPSLALKQLLSARPSGVSTRTSAAHPPAKVRWRTLQTSYTGPHGSVLLTHVLPPFLTPGLEISTCVVFLNSGFCFLCPVGLQCGLHLPVLRCGNFPAGRPGERRACLMHFHCLENLNPGPPIFQHPKIGVPYIFCPILSLFEEKSNSISRFSIRT